MRYLITVSINSLRRLLARNQCSHRYVRSRRFANTPSGNTLIAFDDRYLENGKTSTNIILLDLCIIFLPKSGGLNYYPQFQHLFLFTNLKRCHFVFPAASLRTIIESFIHYMAFGVDDQEMVRIGMSRG